MGTPYLAKVRIFSFNFPPKGWAFCNGQTLPINQNQALFSILGTTYGGNGQTTFALPNLRGRVPLHMGSGFTEGEAGGEEDPTLTLSERPTHTHTPHGAADAPNHADPTHSLWANAGSTNFPATSDAPLSPRGIWRARRS